MLELLEHALTADKRENLTPEEAERAEPEKKFAAGYYARIDYLLQLEAMLKAGFTTDLLADELEGLSVLKAARDEFAIQHPPCGSCGALQYSEFATSCRRCRTQFKRSA